MAHPQAGLVLSPVLFPALLHRIVSHYSLSFKTYITLYSRIFHADIVTGKVAYDLAVYSDVLGRFNVTLYITVNLHIGKRAYIAVYHGVFGYNGHFLRIISPHTAHKRIVAAVV